MTVPNVYMATWLINVYPCSDSLKISPKSATYCLIVGMEELPSHIPIVESLSKAVIKKWLLENNENLPLCSLEIFEMTTGMLCSAPP